MKPSILIIDDDLDICALVRKYLNKNGFLAESTISAVSAFKKLEEKEFDVVVCDYRLGDANGLEVLTRIKKTHPRTEVIIITAYSDIKTAVNLIKSGAFDYMCKPLIPEELTDIIYKALAHHRQRVSNQSFPSGHPEGGPGQDRNQIQFFEGNSVAIREVYRQVEIVAPTNYSIILHGESGSGKEVIARIIHQKSNRKDHPFIALDCGTLSRDLANSELFGHIKGSFTGAISDKKGHFELANGGTLFLDEVANLQGETQAALLRVIQERKMKRIGSTQEIDLDIRIIVASHENLRTAGAEGFFREDLFHRLNEFAITLPPLRERREDIPGFATYFLKLTNIETGKQIDGFEDEVIERFLHYNWPGNARELKNVIRKAVLLTPYGKITTAALSPELLNVPAKPENKRRESPTLSASFSNPDLKEVSREVEYQTIMEVLRSVHFNKSKAAKILHIDRKTLYNKIKEYER